MKDRISEWSGLSFETIPSTGVVVNGERFSHIPFVETKGLHFEPQKEMAEA